MKTDFTYKLSPEAKWAQDVKGNSAPVYVKIALNVTKEYATTKYGIAHNILIPLVAEQTLTDVSHIQPISLEEYIAETNNQ